MLRINSPGARSLIVTGVRRVCVVSGIRKVSGVRRMASTSCNSSAAPSSSAHQEMVEASDLPSARAASVSQLQLLQHSATHVRCPDGVLDLLVADAPLPQRRGEIESFVDQYSREQVRHSSRFPISAKKFCDFFGRDSKQKNPQKKCARVQLGT